MTIEFPPHISYGVPNPDNAVARIVEGPLNKDLIEVFDELTTTAFRIQSFECGEDWERLPRSSAVHVDEALTEVGNSLLGDRSLVSDVLTYLGDSLAQGNVLYALAGLYEAGDIGLGEAMRSQLVKAGEL